MVFDKTKQSEARTSELFLYTYISYIIIFTEDKEAGRTNVDTETSGFASS
jgi:hypothetical protein